MLKKSLVLILIAAFLVTLTGCNAMHGLGRDIEALGEGMQEAMADAMDE